MNILTPEFFSMLVLVVIVVGVILAAIRIYSDFKSGPRWPEDLQEKPKDDRH